MVFNFCEEKIGQRDTFETKCSNEAAGSFAYGFTDAACTSLLKTDGGDPNTLADNIMDSNTELVAGANLTYENAGSKCPTDTSKPFILNVGIMCVKGGVLQELDSEISADGCEWNLKYSAD